MLMRLQDRAYLADFDISRYVVTSMGFPVRPSNLNEAVCYSVPVFCFEMSCKHW